MESDIIVYDAIDENNILMSGEAISQEEYKWPLVNGLVRIPYETSLWITEDKMKNITRAMDEYSNKTCVRYLKQLIMVKHGQRYDTFVRLYKF